MNEQETKTCPLCGGVSYRTYEKMRGYVEGTTYDLYECSMCNASFSDPLLSDKDVYDHIYAQAENVPGYERYIRYSKLVKKTRHPLDALSNAENAYWGVREALRQYFPNKKEVSIIEIGSGLGYLTYSLNKEGYETKGVDISSEAVEKARQAYGDYYEAGDILVLSEKYQNKFDCVVMTELIEHVEDPKKFMAAALSMLTTGGKLIITTPNKSWAPKGYIWGSDAPPIHLWWIGEETLKYLAKSFGRTCTFVDFTNFTKMFYEPLWYPTVDEIQADLPKISKEGMYIGNDKVRNFKSQFLSVKIRYMLSYIRRRLKNKNVNSRTSTLCAVIS